MWRRIDIYNWSLYWRQVTKTLDLASKSWFWSPLPLYLPFFFNSISWDDSWFDVWTPLAGINDHTNECTWKLSSCLHAHVCRPVLVVSGLLKISLTKAVSRVFHANGRRIELAFTTLLRCDMWSSNFNSWSIIAPVYSMLLVNFQECFHYTYLFTHLKIFSSGSPVEKMLPKSYILPFLCLIMSHVFNGGNRGYKESMG